MSEMEKVIENWEREGISLLPPNEEAAVIAALNKTGRKYSRDLVDLYCATGGMKNGEMDSLLLSLWTLDRVVSEGSGYERPFIPFADWLMDSHFYCLKYEDEAKSSVYVDFFSGEEPQRLAESLSEFFELYLAAPEKIELYDLPPRRI